MNNETTAYDLHAEYERIRKEQKSKIRKKALLIGGIAVGLSIIGISVFVFGLNALMKGSDAYAAATTYISQNEMVKAHSGGIKDFGPFPISNISTTNGYGTADFIISVNGKKHDLDVTVYLEKEPGSEWQVLEMEIE